MILTNHFPILQILFPFLGALLTTISFRFVLLARIIASICSLISLLISIYGYIIVKNTQISYIMGGWDSWNGIEYYLTPLNQTIIIYLNLVLLFFLAFCRNITDQTILKHINNNRKSLFYAVLLFAHTGYLGMISTNDFFNLYVFIEISSLSSYVLIASGSNPKALVGAIDYLIIGSIGATLILIAIGFLLSSTGSLNMLDVAGFLQQYSNSRIVTLAIGFFLIGVILKTASFPMHFWMMRAYSNTASVILVYLASISTIIGIYIIYKFTYIIINYETIKIAVTYFIRPIALATLIIAPYLAYKCENFKKIIIYSCFTQIGYVFLSYVTDGGMKILPSLLLVDSINKIALFLIAAYNEAYSEQMKNRYTKINLEKSKETVSRGPQRILIREHPRTYKDIVTNFSSSSSIYQKKPNSVLIIIAIICSSGLPISPLFFIKLDILELLLRQNLLLDFAMVLLSSVGSLFYHYKMVLLLFRDLIVESS